jgi:hypothetical protein
VPREGSGFQDNAPRRDRQPDYQLKVIVGHRYGDIDSADKFFSQQMITAPIAKPGKEDYKVITDIKIIIAS